MAQKIIKKLLKFSIVAFWLFCSTASIELSAQEPASSYTKTTGTVIDSSVFLEGRIQTIEMGITLLTNRGHALSKETRKLIFNRILSLISSPNQGARTLEYSIFHQKERSLIVKRIESFIQTTNAGIIFLFNWKPEENPFYEKEWIRIKNRIQSVTTTVDEAEKLLKRKSSAFSFAEREELVKKVVKNLKELERFEALLHADSYNNIKKSLIENNKKNCQNQFAFDF